MSRESKAGPGGGTRAGEKGKRSAALRQSASVVLLSPTNQILLVHRVQTSSAFPSAHVFPGGMVSPGQDGDLPPDAHRDSPASRLAAIRETFEESGILLARRVGAPGAGPGAPRELLHVPDAAREEARKQIHGNQLRFAAWLEGLGGAPDTESLIPFTRWITPPPVSKRFSTQMYIYMLPQSSPAGGPSAAPSVPAAAVVPLPTPDGGIEHTAAEFADAADWLARQRAGGVILYPPQLYLLSVLSRFLAGPPPPPPPAGVGGAAAPRATARDHYASQRDALLRFAAATPTASAVPPGAGAREHPTARIPWADKVICPYVLQAGGREDGRVVLGLDKPGPELEGSGRGGDWSRVVLVRFDKKVPRDVEVRERAEVMGDESARAKAKF